MSSLTNPLHPGPGERLEIHHRAGAAPIGAHPPHEERSFIAAGSALGSATTRAGLRESIAA